MPDNGLDQHPWVTDRLRLRVPTGGDVDAMLALHQDPLAVAHNPSDALSDRDAAAKLIQRWQLHWNDHGIGYFLIQWRAGHEVLGVCGVKVMSLNGRRVFNLLYRLTPTVWRRGVATEAATAAVEHARHHPLGLPVVARVRPENRASARVALGVGLHRASHLDLHGEDGPDQIYIVGPAP